MFVLPVCLLYLPFILKIKDVEQKRIWVILTSGILIGPAVFLLWYLVLILRGVLRGESAYAIWQNDPDVPGKAVRMAFVAIVGLAIASLYALFLRLRCTNWHRKQLYRVRIIGDQAAAKSKP